MNNHLRTRLIGGAISVLGFAHAIAQQAAPASAPAGPAGATGDPAAQLSVPVPTLFTSKIGFFTMEQVPGAMYPRVIQLKYYAAAKGQLLATFSQREQSLPIFRSTDNG